jgi:wobble nucleotide-excising tRNase
MKIQVNKNQQEINFKSHVGTIITIAMKKAREGYNRFSYPIPRNQGISSYDLIDRVEKETDDSVYGGHKCIKDGHINFSIRD